jgi:hypothetical protein
MSSKRPVDGHRPQNIIQRLCFDDLALDASAFRPRADLPQDPLDVRFGRQSKPDFGNYCRNVRLGPRSNICLFIRSFASTAAQLRSDRRNNPPARGTWIKLTHRPLAFHRLTISVAGLSASHVRIGASARGFHLIPFRICAYHRRIVRCATERDNASNMALACSSSLSATVVAPGR